MSETRSDTPTYSKITSFVPFRVADINKTVTKRGFDLSPPGKTHFKPSLIYGKHAASFNFKLCVIFQSTSVLDFLRISGRLPFKS